MIEKRNSPTDLRGCLAGAGESDAEVVVGGTAESEELSAEHLRLLAPLRLAKAELSTIASLPSVSYYSFSQLYHHLVKQLIEEQLKT